MTEQPLAILTVGHSNRRLDEFLDLLRTHGVAQVADVRTVPRSRHNPQFGRETLAEALADAGIGYRHFKGLGGWRKPHADSLNQGLTSEGFRGYADYMLSDAFAGEVAALIGFARECTTAVMCAEAVPWRCHRSLLADALAVRGIAVEHITGPGARRRHERTAWAEVDGTRITYPFTLRP